MNLNNSIERPKNPKLFNGYENVGYKIRFNGKSNLLLSFCQIIYGHK